MKKRGKRIVCGALLFVTMLSSLALERVFALQAEGGVSAPTTTAAVLFENSAEQMDTTALKVRNFNDGVRRVEEATYSSGEALQPYASYYDGKYLLPMGVYPYLYDERNGELPSDERFYAISRYNEYAFENGVSDRFSTTEIVSAAVQATHEVRFAEYTVSDVRTGERIVFENGDTLKAVDEGTGVTLGIEGNASGVYSNGEYEAMLTLYEKDPKAYTVYGDDPATEEAEQPDNVKSTQTFTFAVDHEAPVLEDLRVRYEKDGRIWLDADVYDNRYAQALFLCYVEKGVDGKSALRLVTDYPTPVVNAECGGTTTVSVDVTEFYEEYGDRLYLHLDDYAMNGNTYAVDLAKANASSLPANGKFALDEGEEALELGIYETHTVSLLYNGVAELANFGWTSSDPFVAAVKNGEIVGLKAGKAKIYVHGYGVNASQPQTIEVTVTDERITQLPAVPSISLGVIKTSGESLAKADGTVTVDQNRTFALEVLPKPWYHPMTDITFVWKTSDEAVAAVDEKGVVTTKKAGVAAVTGFAKYKGEDTQFVCRVTLNVADEWDVRGNTLYGYHGAQTTLEIPADRNIKYIAEEAFKGNATLQEVIFPASLVCIDRRAFANCTALEKVDFSSSHDVRIAEEAFLGCTALAQVSGSFRIETVKHRAFKDCTSLQTVEISLWESCGDNVFENCTGLQQVLIGPATSIGKYMFKGCTGLAEVEIRAQKVGDGAFYGCTSLDEVTFDRSGGSFELGAYAFAYCGTKNGAFSVAVNGGAIVALGDGAFAHSALSALDIDLGGLRTLGAGVFENTQITTIGIDDGLDTGLLTMLGVPFEGLTLRVTGGTRYTEESGLIFEAANGGRRLVYVNPTAPASVDLANVVEIGAYAFSGNRTVTSVTVEPTLTKIRTGAFENAAVEKINGLAGTGVTEIPARAFYGSALKQLDMPENATTIGAYAFADCNALKYVNLERVTTIGEGAFLNAARPEKSSLKYALLSGNEEVTVGAYAFAGNANLTVVNLEKASSIGAFAFYGTGLVSVDLQSATEVGEGAFARAQSLAQIKMGETGDNGVFTVIDNVLYRYLDKEKGTLVLVCYPAGATAREVTTENALGESADEAQTQKKRVFSIAEGALRVQAYAFCGLKTGAVDEVVLPYSVKVIDEAAFLDSGVETFTFDGVQAPVFGYGSFDDAIGERALTYPKNGVGYDSYFYRRYFATRAKTDIRMTDVTRTSKRLVESMADAETVRSWLELPATAETLRSVTEFSLLVKEARMGYNAIVGDEDQLTLFGQENADKLVGVETELRAVKQYFQIPTWVESLRCAASSVHKSTYTYGEKFDMSGLTVDLVYDDGSTQTANPFKLTLLDTHALTASDRYVRVQYTDGDVKKVLYVTIDTVAPKPVTSVESGVRGGSQLGLVVGLLGGVVMVVGLATAEFFVIKKRRAKASGADDASTGSESKK